MVYNKGMNEETLRKNISQKITFYRKAAGLTQLELAEKLNYSDKSVSKWERGDGLPDITVLSNMAELFGISVDDFISSAACLAYGDLYLFRAGGSRSRPVEKVAGFYIRLPGQLYCYHRFQLPVVENPLSNSFHQRHNLDPCRLHRHHP